MHPQLVAVVTTCLIFVFTVWRDSRTRKAELLRNYTNDFYQDSRITELFMAVDRKDFSFEKDKIGTDAELQLIRVLDFLNILGHNWRRGVISLSDIAPTTLGYAAVQVHANEAVTTYLSLVESSDEERYRVGTAFGYFRELAAELATYPDSKPKRLLHRVAKFLRISGANPLLEPRAVAETASVVTNALEESD